MKGKSKCRILKEIRKTIAKENDIEYVTSECKYQGDCSGTCPKCEAEVRYLEKELEKRRNAGKTVAVAGIAASMVLSSGCVFSENGPFSEKTMGDMEMISSEYSQERVSEENSYMGVDIVSEAVDGEIYETMGQIIDPSLEIVEGKIVLPSDDESDLSEEIEDSSLFEESENDILPSMDGFEIMGEFPAPEDE